jgi:hypothetical protein
MAEFEEYSNYFDSENLDVSESKIISLVNSIERKSLYPVYLKFHNRSIADLEKLIKDLEKRANLKKNIAMKDTLLKIAIPYRKSVKQHQIAIRVIQSLM